MKLLIVDDNIKYRHRLASVISSIKGIEVVGQAGDVPEAIDAVKRMKLDTIILDIHMPGGSGLDVLRASKSISPAPLVIMLTVGPESEYRDTCFALGADYFFEKSNGIRAMMSLLIKMVHKSRTHRM